MLSMLWKKVRTSKCSKNKQIYHLQQTLFYMAFGEFQVMLLLKVTQLSSGSDISKWVSEEKNLFAQPFSMSSYIE